MPLQTTSTGNWQHEKWPDTLVCMKTPSTTTPTEASAAPTTTSPVAASPVTASPTGWIGWSWLVGMIVGISFGWVLAYLAMLPFFLGLFFFMVLGLLTGAVMFRVGSRAALPTTPWLWLIGSSVAATMLLTCLWVEYRDLPSMKRSCVGGTVRQSYHESFTQQELTNFEKLVRYEVASHLEHAYPPGGFIGYLQWTARDGSMKISRFPKARFHPNVSPATDEPWLTTTIDYKLPQRQWTWLLRIVVSALLLEGSIMSQVLALRSAPPKK